MPIFWMELEAENYLTGAGSPGTRAPTFYLFRMWCAVCRNAWKTRLLRLPFHVPVYSLPVFVAKLTKLMI